MNRSRAERVVAVVLTLLTATLPLGVLAVLAAGAPVTLEATPVAWLPAALAVALVAAAACAAIVALVEAIGRGSLAAAGRFGSSAAVAGGGVVALADASALGLPLLTASVLLFAATVARRVPAIRTEGAIIGAAISVLVLAEVAALAHLLPATSRLLVPFALPTVAAAFVIAALAVIAARGAALASVAAALAIAAAGLLIARDGSLESVVALTAMVGSQLLALRAAFDREGEDEDEAGSDERLPELASRLSDAVLRFDGRLELRDWNAAAAGLLGLDSASAGTRLEDLLGVTIAELPRGDETIDARRILGGLEVAMHRSGLGVTAVIRDPGAAPEAEQLAAELRTTIEELLRARRTIDLQRGELERAATIDPLTGVASRGTILDRLRLEVAQARRYQHPLAVVLLDIDGFREINRQHGIAGGDSVLREVALRIRLRVREADALGRAGSDGFLAALPHTDEAGAAIFADALQHRLGLRPVTIGDQLVPVTVSIGVATIRAGDDLDLDALLGRVEEALASARSQGGNRIALDRRHGLVRLDDPHATRGASRPGGEIAG